MNKEGKDNEYMLNMIDNIYEYSVRCHHKHFHNQLFSGQDHYSIYGDMFTSTINGSMFTYELAPIFSMMEKNIFEYLNNNYIHWNNIDGLFAPGGSLSNF